jgi:hypothetical protein
MPIKVCCACNKEYKIPAYREKVSKYCSKECLNSGQYLQHKKVCLGCNKDFLVSNSRLNKKYCSLDCKSLVSKTTKERRKESKELNILKRGSNSYRQTRRLVFKYKPKECQVCNYNEYDFCLDIHHLDENPNNNSVENLAVLCVMCHRKLHKGVINAVEIREKSKDYFKQYKETEV